ncbi:hypothetical protein LCGC14_1075360 [marine sediment metagenome]|uniref:Uncharacterized protein n=1 Tax=marine sediment metagenome TaxID=412755 RepID=A0A0F9QMR1_9ZZZZ
MTEENKTKKRITILLIVGIGYLVPWTIMVVMNAGSESTFGPEVVPVFGLPGTMHMLFALVISPLICIIVVMIIPVLIAPVFLRLKKMMLRKYENTFIQLEEDPIDLKKFFKRSVYVFLLTFGLIATLLNYGVFTAESFVNPTRLQEMQVGDESILYNLLTIFGLVGAVLPIVIGLWSIGWIIEDSGLMHYKLSKESSFSYFEIEPVHIRYNAIVKGYAGITGILFLINAAQYWSQFFDDIVGYINFGLLVFYLFPIMMMIMPAYVLYWKFCRPYMTKKLIKNLKESELLLEMKFKS